MKAIVFSLAVGNVEGSDWARAYFMFLDDEHSFFGGVSKMTLPFEVAKRFLAEHGDLPAYVEIHTSVSTRKGPGGERVPILSVSSMDFLLPAYAGDIRAMFDSKLSATNKSVATDMGLKKVN